MAAEGGKVEDAWNRGGRLRLLREKLNLTGLQLSLLADVPASVISQVENGYRAMTGQVQERISSALGLTMGSWFARTWRFEPLLVQRRERYEARLADQERRVVEGGEGARAGRLVERSTLIWDEAKSAYRSYEAHRTMIEKGYYQFVRLDQATATHDPDADMLRLFSGGSVQLAIFQIRCDDPDELVVDAHAGEELYYIIDGDVDCYILRRPGAQASPADTAGPWVRMEADALDMLRQGARETYAKPEFEDLEAWLAANLVEETVGERRYYRAPAEVSSVGPGDVLRVDSKWPHGCLCRCRTGDSGELRLARILFGAAGSYFGYDGDSGRRGADAS